MFDIGFSELMVIGVVALLVLGPERLPGAARTAGLWIGRIRRSFAAIKTEVEREIGADEIRRQLHNENILAMERQQQQASATDTKVPPAAPLPGLGLAGQARRTVQAVQVASVSTGASVRPAAGAAKSASGARPASRSRT